MAEAVFNEARGESRAGQYYVAAIVKNRVLDSRFEDDFCSVVEEPYQFSYVHELSESQIKQRIESEEAAWERAQNVAYSVVNSGEEPLFNNILYYHANRVTPDWNYSVIERVGVIGRHTFYTDKE